jgi:TPR repeat protein
VFQHLDDLCGAAARHLFRLSAVSLILLASATAMAPLRADESAAQRQLEGQAGAGQLLDGFERYTIHDYVRARALLEPLAQHGNPDAQQLLGSMYAKGEGVPQDDARAAQWLSLAAEQGKVDAQFALGIMYRDGVGVPKDRALALTWLRRAAEQQHSDAANSVGELYRGSASTVDHQEAAAWFERAALLGNGTAQFNLGVLFAFGRGVRQSDTQAYKWFELSAGSMLGAERDTAWRELVAMRERMMPAQVEVANLLTRDWVFRARWARWGRW